MDDLETDGDSNLTASNKIGERENGDEIQSTIHDGKVHSDLYDFQVSDLDSNELRSHYRDIADLDPPDLHSADLNLDAVPIIMEPDLYDFQVSDLDPNELRSHYRDTADLDPPDLHSADLNLDAVPIIMEPDLYDFQVSDLDPNELRSHYRDTADLDPPDLHSADLNLDAVPIIVEPDLYDFQVSDLDPNELRSHYRDTADLDPPDLHSGDLNLDAVPIIVEPDLYDFQVSDLDPNELRSHYRDTADLDPPDLHSGDLNLDAVPIIVEPDADKDYVYHDVAPENVGQEVDLRRSGMSMFVKKITRGDLVVGDKLTQHVHYGKLEKHVYRYSAGYEQIKDQSGADLRSTEDDFVETDIFWKSVALLQQYGVMIITGCPGSGKTTLAKGLLRHFEKQGYTPLILHRHGEWRQYVGGEDRTVVLLDNVFGELCVDHRRFTKWSNSFACMCEFAKQSKCLTVLTMFTHIHSEIQASVTCGQVFKGVRVLTLGESNDFSTEEKAEMLRTHLKANGWSVSEAEINEVLSKDTSGPVFPWCAAKFSELSPQSRERSSVFSLPEMAYVTFFRKVLSDKENGHLVEAMLRLSLKSDGDVCSRNQANKELAALGQSPSSAPQLQTILRHFTQSYFCGKCEGKNMTKCRLQDVAVLTLAAVDLPGLLDILILKLLVQYIHAEESGARVSVRLEKNSPAYEILHRKLYDEVVKGNTPQVVQHPSLGSAEYLSDFADYLVKNGYVDTFLTAGDSVRGENVLYWSVFSQFSPTAPSTHLSGGRSGTKEVGSNSCLVLTQWCLRMMLEHEKEQSELANCLLRMLFLSAICDDGDECKALRNTAAVVKEISNLSCPVKEIALYLPSREQRITPAVKRKCHKFEEKLNPFSHIASSTQLSGGDVGASCVNSESVLYLDDPSLPIPPSVLTVEASENCARLIFPTKLWYLALRCLSDKVVDEKDADSNTLLHLASNTGHKDAARLAIKSGASFTVQNRDQQTPVQLTANRLRERQEKTSGPAAAISSKIIGNFHKLVAEGDVENVKLSLCFNISADEKDAAGVTALHVASKYGQRDMAELLVSVGASVRLKNKAGLTPLHEACQHGHSDIANLLISHGAIVNLPDFAGSTALHAACASGNTDVISLLLQHRAQVNTRNHEGFTPLHIASRKGHCQVAEILLRHGANINSQNNYASTPMHYACSSGQYDMAVLLLQHGADSNRKTTRGSSPFHLACQEGHVHIAELLVSHGVHINMTNTSGSTPLHAACFFQRREVITFLLEHKADPGRRNKDGYTPLHLACERGDRETAELLIQHGADVHNSDKSGFTSLHYAAYFGHVATASLLLRHNADVNAVTRPNRCTSLILASQRGHRPVVELLIQHGADVNLKDRAGSRPLDKARQNGHKDTAALLVQHGARGKYRVFASIKKRKYKSRRKRLDDV